MRAKRPADQVRALFYRKKLMLRFGKALKKQGWIFRFYMEKAVRKNNFKLKKLEEASRLSSGCKIVLTVAAIRTDTDGLSRQSGL